MNPLARLTHWRDLVDETTALVTDFKAAFAVDADHAVPGMPIRLASLRGQTKVLCPHDCPAPNAWTAARAFLPVLREFCGLQVTPALHLAMADELLTLARVLGQALPAGATTRHRADIDG